MIKRRKGGETMAKSKIIAFIAVVMSLSLIVTLGGNSRAQTTVYTNDFEGTVGAEWCSTSVSTTPIGARNFLGPFGCGTRSLTLTGLPSHTEVTVSFELFIIGMWVGNSSAWGPDSWNLSVDDGPTLLHTTFSNSGAEQAYPGTFPGDSNLARTGAAENNALGYTYPGYGEVGDSVYNLSFTFAHSASSLILNFTGGPGVGVGQCWGIDNIVVQAR
jgi:hypothetical protein